MPDKDHPELLRDSAARILVFAGIALLLVNMLLGEVFAIFISHVANAEIRERWLDVINATTAGKESLLNSAFERIEFLLDRRGRIMNAHSHAGAFGVLALILALLQPLLTYRARTRVYIASLIVAGGIIQPLFIFISSWTGTWANYVSHLGALCICIGLLATMLSVFSMENPLPDLKEQLSALLKPYSSRLLSSWGALLVLLGMLFGLYYAWVFTTQHEPRQFELLDHMLALTSEPVGVEQLVNDYRRNNSLIAITTAVHSHAIEMGTIALLLAFIQSFIFYSEKTRMRWACVFLAGAYLLPFFIFNATIYGLKSAALADLAGFIVIVALFAMLFGTVRQTALVDQTK